MRMWAALSKRYATNSCKEPSTDKPSGISTGLAGNFSFLMSGWVSALISSLAAAANALRRSYAPLASKLWK